MRALFLGSKDLGLAILRCLRDAEASVDWAVIHPADGGDARSALQSFRRYADDQRMDLAVASSPAEAKRMIEAFGPDIVFVCGWYWIFGEDLLASVPRGFFGLHNSLLPKYRGGAPLVWSMMNGDPAVGTTAFRLSAGIDDGDILLQVRVPTAPDDRIGDVLGKIETELLAALPGKWRELIAGRAVLTAQSEAEATYCGQRRPDDGRIDWRLPASRIHDFVRAQAPPYPGAFSHMGDRKVTILRTTVDDRVFYGSPGQVLQKMPDFVVIACGDHTAVRVIDVSVDGEPAKPRDVFASLRLRLE